MARGLEIAARILAAAVGGYGLAWGVCALMAVLLPLPPADAVVIATLVAFLVHVGAILWVFAARRLAAAVVWLALPAGASVAAALWAM